MARRLLGTGITNSNGVATLDTAPDGTTALTHSYTGVGAGKIDIVAESGTLQSGTYEVIDAIFYDKAVTGFKNTNWTASRVTVSETDATGTSLYSENGQGHYWANATSRSITGSFVCEFDLISYSDTNTVAFRIRGDATTDHYFQFQARNIAPNSHIKITYDGTALKYQINDNTPVNWVTASYTSIELALRLYGVGDTLKYANFVIYPI